MDGLLVVELGPLKLAPRGARLIRTRRELAPRGPRAVRRPARGHWVLQSAAARLLQNDQCIVDQFETFLARLARSHPDLLLKDAATSVPIYFAGESHAGHYIPLMVQKLLYYATSGITWDVKGAALGNAWVDPWHQYDATRAARL